MAGSLPTLPEVSKWQPKDVAAYIFARFSSTPVESGEALVVEKQVYGMSFLNFQLNDWLELGFIKGLAVGIVGLRDEIKENASLAAYTNRSAPTMSKGGMSSHQSALNYDTTVERHTKSDEQRERDMRCDAGRLESYGQVRFDKVPKASHVFTVLSRGPDVKNGRLALKKTGHRSQWLQMVDNHREIRNAVLSTFPIFTLPQFKPCDENRKWIARRDKLIQHLMGSGILKPICWPTVSYSVPERFIRETINLMIGGQKRRLSKCAKTFEYERNYEKENDVILLASSMRLKTTHLKFFDELFFAGCKRPSLFASKEIVIGTAKVQNQVDGENYALVQIKMRSIIDSDRDVYLPFENGNSAAQKRIQELAIDDELQWPESMTISAMDKRFESLDNDDDDFEDIGNADPAVTHAAKKRRSDGSVNSIPQEYCKNEYVSLLCGNEKFGLGLIHEIDPAALAHGIPIGEGNVSLNIYYLEKGSEELPMPFPTSELEILRDLGNDMKQWFVRWPKSRLRHVPQIEAQKILSDLNSMKENISGMEDSEDDSSSGDDDLQAINSKQMSILEKMSPLKHKTICMIALDKEKIDDVNAVDLLKLSKELKKRHKKAFSGLLKSKVRGADLYKLFVMACVKCNIVKISKEGWRTGTINHSTVTIDKLITL